MAVLCKHAEQLWLIIFYTHDFYNLNNGNKKEVCTKWEREKESSGNRILMQFHKIIKFNVCDWLKTSVFPTSDFDLSIFRIGCAFFCSANQLEVKKHEGSLSKWRVNNILSLKLGIMIRHEICYCTSGRANN